MLYSISQKMFCIAIFAEFYNVSLIHKRLRRSMDRTLVSGTEDEGSIPPGAI